MKWRISTDGKPKVAEVLVIALLVGAAWFGTTLAFDVLLSQSLDLPKGLRVYDRILAYLLPQIFGLPLWITLAIFDFERKWKYQLFLWVRLNYCALVLALLLWCVWIYRIGGNPSYGVPADDVQSAAYASICFPLALACICLFVVMLRRTPRRD